jgi:heme-degrading monooxygenase HmoA
MVTIGMNYEVLQGKEEVFERAFNQVLSSMNGMPGHVTSQLFREVGHNTRYLIMSEWNDKEAFDSFVKSDAFAKVTTWGKEQVLSARPQHTVYST